MNHLHPAREIWKYFQPLLGPTGCASTARRGRPRLSCRRTFLGVCYLLWSGCSWRALPLEYGSRSTVHRYFKYWADSEAFSALFKILCSRLNEAGSLDPQIQVIDSSTVTSLFLPKVKAFISVKHRPKRAVKFSVLVDGQGIPLATVMGAANEHDTQLLSKTLEESVVTSGKPPMKTVLLGDTGYVGLRQEKAAKAHGMIGIFPKRKNQSAKTSESEKKYCVKIDLL